MGLTPTGEPGTPTATATTPVSTPVAVALAVTLQRPNALPPAPSWAIPVTLTFHLPGDPTARLYQWRLTLDQGGRWNGSLEIAPGIYDVRLHNLHTLRNVKRNVRITEQLTLNMGTLLEGDADGDNRVRSADFALLRTSYFTQAGNLGFDARTDFDEDQRVRSSDFALLRGNYFATGDIEVPATLAVAHTAAPADLVALSLQPSVTTIAAGDRVTLTLMAHAGAQAFVALDADIRFPPDVLQVVGPDGAPATAIQPLPTLSTLLRNDADNATGRILYGAGLFAGTASGDVAVALIPFRLAPGAGRRWSICMTLRWPRPTAGT